MLIGRIKVLSSNYIKFRYHDKITGDAIDTIKIPCEGLSEQVIKAWNSNTWCKVEVDENGKLVSIVSLE